MKDVPLILNPVPFTHDLESASKHRLCAYMYRMTRVEHDNNVFESTDIVWCRNDADAKKLIDHWNYHDRCDDPLTCFWKYELLTSQQNQEG